VPPPVEGGQRHRDQIAGGGEEHGRVERLGRGALGRPGRGDAEVEGVTPGGGGAGQDVDGGALGQRHLGRQVGRGAEAVEPEPPAGGQRGPAQGPVADDAGAQQWRGRLVVEGGGEAVGVGLVDHGVLGVAAVGVPAGEAGIGAEVLGSPAAPPAPAAGAAQPGDTGPLPEGEAAGTLPPGVDHADDLVAGNDPGPAGGQIPFGQVQVGAAHAAGHHLEADLARPRSGDGPLDGPQRPGVDRPRLDDGPGPHAAGPGGGRRFRHPPRIAPPKLETRL